MEASEKFSIELGTAPACRAFGTARATIYRRRKVRTQLEQRLRPSSPRALDQEERQNVLDILHSERFVDFAPTQVWATLLDEGTHYCSVRTMYRILSDNDEIQERRNQVRHREYTKPELLATQPNQVWSWDITKLKGPAKWTYYYLYVILDIFSRYVVGWMVATQEASSLAKILIEESCEKQKIQSDKLTIHSDRGPSMKSKPVAMLLSDLGVTKSHSRPYVSNDNPFSEAHFKTLKYRPGFPERFGCLEDSRLFCREFFDWYNNHHYHSGLNLLTPAMVHYGESELVLQKRQLVLERSYSEHSERYVNKRSVLIGAPKEVWINPPMKND